MKVEIYTLTDPRDGLIKYVGQTRNSLIQRVWEHCDKISGNDLRTNWIKCLSKLELKPVIEILDEVDESIADEVEMSYIWSMRSWGFHLKNTILDIRKYDHLGKQVYKYDLEGNYIGFYKSVADATRVYGTGIPRAITDVTRTSKGFRWSYTKCDKLKAVIKSNFTKVFAYSYKGEFVGWCSTEELTKTESKAILSFTRVGDKRNTKSKRKGYKGLVWFREYKGLTISLSLPTNTHNKPGNLSITLRYSLG